ncbi:hypothetical protein K3G64_02985 [Mycobacterium sp. IDR2000157661]|nr:hypothetical protein K3G64_02985 [Mycobacterium sp. IDR2000157661]
MHADTEAIRTLASDSTSQADELAAIASALTALPTATAASSFGPVGAPFLAALAEAVAHESRTVATLGVRTGAAGDAAAASAAAYDDADARAGARVGGL